MLMKDCKTKLQEEYWINNSVIIELQECTI